MNNKSKTMRNSSEAMSLYYTELVIVWGQLGEFPEIQTGLLKTGMLRGKILKSNSPIVSWDNEYLWIQ